MPQLCLWADGALEVAEKDWFLAPGGWNLLDFPAELNPGEFNIQEKAESFLIDINGRQLTTRYLGAQLPLDFKDVDSGWTDLQLARWLDGKLYQDDIRQEVLLEWLRRCLNFLIERRGFTLTALSRGRFLLEKALREKIKTCRQSAYEHGYQHILFEDGAKVETSPAYTFAYDPNIYPAHWPYTGRYQFAKHYYSIVGELESGGEEFECAQAIDRCYQVKHWVAIWHNNLISLSDCLWRMGISTRISYQNSRMGVFWWWNIKALIWRNTRRKNAMLASCGQKRARGKPCSSGR